MDRWARLDGIIAKLEQYLVASLLGFMILVAFAQIALRNVFATGLSWADPLVRYLVLWVGFIGASIATKERRHINIDVLSQRVPGLGNTLVRAITDLFAGLMCGSLAFAALKFVRNEAQIGGTTLLGIPTWLLQLIIPLALGLMTLRYGLRSIQAIVGVPEGGSTSDRMMGR